MPFSDLQLQGANLTNGLNGCSLHTFTAFACRSCASQCLSLAEILRQAGYWETWDSSDWQPWLQDSLLDLGKLRTALQSKSFLAILPFPFYSIALGSDRVPSLPLPLFLSQDFFLINLL